MVKICSMTEYPTDNENKYKESFEKYPYELSIFQKYAVEAIIEGHHVLVTAHTGTGKTMPAEFAINHFVSKGKKVIYTGPIKSLINQKFYDFTNKYQHISFGVLTGDIKCNPEADTLVMTAEILLNKLYQKNNKEEIKKISTDFDIDFDNELACVIMDEVHFVNDQDRGYVWENTLMMLPPHVQLVMLSATIDKPENFAFWCENLHKDSGKQVYLTNTTHRVVPLTHYSFITCTQSVFKTIKDKATQEEIKQVINKTLVIQDSNGKFNEENHTKIKKTLALFEKNDIRVKRAHILNQIVEHLYKNEMLPALCFVLSRRQIEVCANEINTTILEFDSKVPYIVDKECEQILRKKLSNFEEYLHLPEYVNMVALLRKGIAIHHSGVLPIIKEIIELLYSKGYIKLLFATETFSIGVNMPTKTVIFTDVNKFDGNTMRLLHSHEMSQMSGRAGRRGLDTVGHVIHLNNLFRNVDLVNYKAMMNGKPQTLTSKFKISYNLLLNLLDTGDKNVVEFANKSMVKDDINSQLSGLTQIITKAETELERLNVCCEHLSTPVETILKFKELEEIKPYTANKKRKEVEKQLQTITDSYKFIKDDSATYFKKIEKEKEINELRKQSENTALYIENGAHNVLELLKEEGFLDEENILTNKGQIAAQLKESHCLAFARLIEDKVLDELSSKQLVCLFSCFTNISVQEDFKDYSPNTDDEEVKKLLKDILKMYEDYQQIEIDYKIKSGIEYNMHYDLLSYVDEWCDAKSAEECKLVLQQLSQEKEVFLGEFVKALLKINNISCEMEKIAEMTGNIAFLSKLREIPQMTLKYVVTNQSLYV